MLPSERHSIILQQVALQPAVSIRQLTDRLGVSRETVRKDIELLAAESKLQQVRGGATQIRTQEPPISDRSQTNLAGKLRIAQHMVAQIPDGASLIIDNGSTTWAVADLLASRRKDLIVYTNDLKIAGILGPVARELTVLGGRLDPLENAAIGLETAEYLARYRAEFALISTGGLSAHALFTDFSREAAALRNQMVQQAERAFVLCDSSKFGVVGQVVMKPLPKTATVVFDTPPPLDIADSLTKIDVSTTVVE